MVRISITCFALIVSSCSLLVNCNKFRKIGMFLNSFHLYILKFFVDQLQEQTCQKAILICISFFICSSAMF